MPKLRRILNSVFGLLLLSGISYCTYNFASAESRVKDLCSQIKPGMSVSELKAFGSEHGLGPQPRNESGISFMVESKTYGRYGCKILLEAGNVKTAEYNFAD